MQSTDNLADNQPHVHMRKYILIYLACYTILILLFVLLAYLFFKIQGKVIPNFSAAAVPSSASVYTATRFTNDLLRPPSRRETERFISVALLYSVFCCTLVSFLMLALKAQQQQISILFLFQVAWQQQRQFVLIMFFIAIISNYLTIRIFFGWFARLQCKNLDKVRRDV